MKSGLVVSAALVMLFLFVGTAIPEDQEGKENTETHQNPDGTWTGTTTYPDHSSKVTDMDKDRNVTHVTKKDPDGNKTEESDWARNGKVDVMRKQHIYAHKEGSYDICESITEFDENGVKLKETVWCGGYTLVDTYARGKRIKREKIVDGKVVKVERFDSEGKIVRTEYFDKDGKRIQKTIAPPAPPNVITPSGAESRATGQLIGIVYDKDSRPGDQVSVSVTTDPQKYKDTPGLGVVEVQVPASSSGSPRATLEGIVIDVGDGQKQRADRSIQWMIPSSVTAIPFTILRADGEPIAKVQVPAAQGPYPPASTNSGRASDFTTPPVVQWLSIIQGPLSGDASTMRLLLDNQPVTIVAATPRSTFFELSADVNPGEHTLSLQQAHAPAIKASIVKTALVMQAGQLQLQKGQSTNYSVTVQLGRLPDSIWQHGGNTPALVSTSQLGKMPQNFRVPQTGEAAVVLLHIENVSRDTVTLKPSQNQTVTRVLRQRDFASGQYTESGMIQSKKSGGFTINATADTFFAPVPFTETNPAATH